MIEGVDVSDKQGVINWRAVASGGKSFAFIRVTDGLQYRDKQFAANWSGAKSAGLLRGGYQYFEPTQNPIAQADMMLSMMGPLVSGDLPPTLDVETLSAAPGGGGGPASLSATADGVAAWVDHVARATGMNPIVYTYPSFWAQLPPRGIERKAMLWAAHWGVPRPTVPGAWKRWAFWQYTSTGSVPGIQGPVDLDRFEGSAIDLRLITRGGVLRIAEIGTAGAVAVGLAALAAVLLIGGGKKS